MVESCPEILKRDSSNPDMCSGGEASFVGISARSSFSTAISKSTTFSANVDMSFEKQNLYTPISFAVKMKSPCRSLLPSRTTFLRGGVHRVIDIKRTTGLYSKVKGNFQGRLVSLSVEACPFVWRELVRQCGSCRKIEQRQQSCAD